MSARWNKAKNQIENFFYKYSDLLIVIMLGTFLRLRNIARFDFWYDEAFTGIMAKQPWEDFVRVASKDVHPPTFLVIVRGWTRLLGVSDVSLRSLPLIFGLLAIILVFLITRELFGKKSAIIATLLSAVSPFLVAYSYEARSYTFFGFLTLAAFYFAIKEKGNLFVLFSILLILTHFMGLLFLPGLLAVFLATKYLNKSFDLKLDVLRGVIILIVTILIFMYMRDNIMESGSIIWGSSASLLRIPESFTAHMFGVQSKLIGSDKLLDYNFPINIYYIGIIGFVLSFIGTIIFFRKAPRGEKRNMAIVLLNMLLPQLFLIGLLYLTNQRAYMERYLLPSSLFLTIAMGTVLVKTLRFESLAVVLILYGLILFRVIEPDYYQGMKNVQKELVYAQHDLVFTKPIDFVVGKYYLYDMKDQVRIFDPENPETDYTSWPFIEEEDAFDTKIENIQNVVFIIPKRSSVPENFKNISEDEYLDYALYVVTAPPATMIED